MASTTGDMQITLLELVYFLQVAPMVIMQITHQTVVYISVQVLLLQVTLPLLLLDTQLIWSAK